MGMNAENSTAQVGLGPNGEVRIRFKEDAQLTTESIAGVLALLKENYGDAPHHLLLMVPMDIDFDVRVLYQDHCAAAQTHELTKSIAWVANCETNKSLITLYNTHHPSVVPVQVFDHEEEASAWLARGALDGSLN